MSEHERREPAERPVTNDQEPTGEQGVSTDKPGVDAGGYPEERALPSGDSTDEDDE